MTRPFTLEKTLPQRRTLVVLFILSLLGVQYGVSTFDSHTWAGTLPLLVSLLVGTYTSHALLSNGWHWNRLFALPESQLDEYELHERNALYARAFRSPWLLLLLSLGLSLAGQVFGTLTGIAVSGEMSWMSAAIMMLITLWSLPRLLAAWSTPDAVTEA